MNLHHPGARREGMLIQSMVTGDVVETIAGVNRDPAFGSAVVVGLGGIFVELLRDVSLELAPLSPARAKAMINRLQAAKLLQGFRGKQPADIAALEETLVRLGGWPMRSASGWSLSISILSWCCRKDRGYASWTS